MRDIISSIQVEFQRYKKLGEGAIEQLRDNDLNFAGPGEANSVAVIVWHISGNLKSRFTDFLTSDGEKPWRHRDEEFRQRTVNSAELREKWNEGWSVLFNALESLTDADLSRSVAIRGVALRVDEALHRSLAHTSYHVGQIVHIAKTLRVGDWKSLSIPLGKSKDYNLNPTRERPA